MNIHHTPFRFYFDQFQSEMIILILVFTKHYIIKQHFLCLNYKQSFSVLKTTISDLQVLSYKLRTRRSSVIEIDDHSYIVFHMHLLIHPHFVDTRVTEPELDPVLTRYMDQATSMFTTRLQIYSIFDLDIIYIDGRLIAIDSGLQLRIVHLLDSE